MPRSASAGPFFCGGRLLFLLYVVRRSHSPLFAPRYTEKPFMENDCVKSERIIKFSSYLPVYRNYIIKNTSDDAAVIVSDLATPESTPASLPTTLVDNNGNSPKRYTTRPHALMDPSDPYGMRWTSYNGSTTVMDNNDKNTETTPLEPVIQDSSKQSKKKNKNILSLSLCHFIAATCSFKLQLCISRVTTDHACWCRHDF